MGRQGGWVSVVCEIEVRWSCYSIPREVNQKELWRSGLELTSATGYCWNVSIITSPQTKQAAESRILISYCSEGGTVCLKSAELSMGILELDAFYTFELSCLHSKENVILKRAKGYNGQRPPSDACAQTLTITKQRRRKAGTYDCTRLHVSLIYCFTGSDLQMCSCSRTSV